MVVHKFNIMGIINEHIKENIDKLKHKSKIDEKTLNRVDRFVTMLENILDKDISLNKINYINNSLDKLIDKLSDIE